MELPNIFILKSTPILKASLVFKNVIRILISADKIEANINITVIGKIKSFGLSYSKYVMNKLNEGLLKILSGAIRTPRKGTTAPILITSAKDPIIISITKMES
jgi:hypothetical protein